MAKRKVGRPKGKKGKGKTVKALRAKVTKIKKQIKTKLKAKAKTKAKQKGKGLGDFIKNAWSKVKRLAGPITDVLKKTKLISTVGSMMGPTGQTVGGIADSMGYGKLKYHKRR